MRRLDTLIFAKTSWAANGKIMKMALKLLSLMLWGGHCATDTAHCDFWIGLRRSRGKTVHSGGTVRRGSWGWEMTTPGRDQAGRRASNTAVYGHWNTGEPNNSGGNEDCAQALWMFSWRWNDTPCSSSLACYACQTSPTRSN